MTTLPKHSSNIFLSLDLEMNQNSGKIIQIGACVGNVYTGELLGEFSQLVKIDEPLNPFIVKLCGITDADLHSDGVTLLEAYERLLKFRNHFETIQRNPLTWGGGDSNELHTQLGHVESWPFGRRWLDLKTVFQFYQLSKQQKVQSGLAKSMNKLGRPFKGTKHNAKDDAINTFYIAHDLIGKFNVAN